MKKSKIFTIAIITIIIVIGSVLAWHTMQSQEEVTETEKGIEEQIAKDAEEEEVEEPKKEPVEEESLFTDKMLVAIEPWGGMRPAGFEHSLYSVDTETENVEEVVHIEDDLNYPLKVKGYGENIVYLIREVFTGHKFGGPNFLRFVDHKTGKWEDVEIIDWNYERDEVDKGLIDFVFDSEGDIIYLVEYFCNDEDSCFDLRKLDIDSMEDSLILSRLSEYILPAEQGWPQDKETFKLVGYDFEKDLVLIEQKRSTDTGARKNLDYYLFPHLKDYFEPGDLIKVGGVTVEKEGEVYSTKNHTLSFPKRYSYLEKRGEMRSKEAFCRGEVIDLEELFDEYDFSFLRYSPLVGCNEKYFKEEEFDISVFDESKEGNEVEDVSDWKFITNELYELKLPADWTGVFVDDLDDRCNFFERYENQQGDFFEIRRGCPGSGAGLDMEWTYQFYPDSNLAINKKGERCETHFECGSGNQEFNLMVYPSDYVFSYSPAYRSPKNSLFFLGNKYREKNVNLELYEKILENIDFVGTLNEEEKLEEMVIGFYQDISFQESDPFLNKNYRDRPELTDSLKQRLDQITDMSEAYYHPLFCTKEEINFSISGADVQLIKEDTAHIVFNKGAFGPPREDYDPRHRVTLKLIDGEWKINEIDCHAFAPTGQKIFSPQQRGEVWRAGNTHDIKWVATDLDEVNIVLFDERAGRSYKVIARDIPAHQRKYSWKVPEKNYLSGDTAFRIWIGEYSPPEESGDWEVLREEADKMPSAESVMFSIE